jgi:hypothetical protein
MPSRPMWGLGAHILPSSPIYRHPSSALDKAGMHLARDQNRIAALKTVEVWWPTPFPEHDLWSSAQGGHRLLPTGPLAGASRSIRKSGLEEIRTPQLPFATLLPRENQVAA